MDTTSGATGVEIQNDGTPVRAIFYVGSDWFERYKPDGAPATVTVHGVNFQNGSNTSGNVIDADMTASPGGQSGIGWGGGGQTQILDTDYRAFITSMLIVGNRTLNIPVTSGKTYRVQLISNKTHDGVWLAGTIEGSEFTFSKGINDFMPVVLAMTFTARDNTLNVNFNGGGNHITGYVLHEVTPVSSPYASWAGSNAFDSLNSEGVAYGMAWILGVPSNSSPALA